MDLRRLLHRCHPSSRNLRILLLGIAISALYILHTFPLFSKGFTYYAPPPLHFVFGLISDLQYADVPDGANLDTGRRRFYRDSLRKLRRAVEDWNRKRVQCVVDLGDVIDGSSAKSNKQKTDLNSLEMALSNLTAPYYQLLGNHDLLNLDFSEWRRQTHLKQRNAISNSASDDVSKSASDAIFNSASEAVSKSTSDAHFRFSLSPAPNIRFLMLNSFAFGVMGHQLDKRETGELSEAWETLRRNNPNENPNSVSGLGEGSANQRWTAYNAALGVEQRKWMEEELLKAEERKEKVIIFSHIPLHPEVSKFIAWDYAEALDVLARHGETILAVISGHDHDGAHHYDKQRNIAFVTLKGAVERPLGASGHYVARISEDGKLTISGNDISIGSIVVDSVKGFLYYLEKT